MYVSLAFLNAYANDVIKLKLDQSFFKFSGLTLEKSSPKDLFRIFGKVESLERVDKKHDPYRYIYFIESQFPTVITFEAEWAYDFEKLSGLSIQRQISPNAPKGSRKIKNKDVKVVTGNGIYLGMDRDNFIKCTPGQPTIQGDSLIYRYESYEKLSEPKDFPFPGS